MMRTPLNTETLSGLLFVAIAIFFLAGTLDLSYGGTRRIGPAAFPALVAGLLLLAGIFVALRGCIEGGPSISGLVHSEKLAIVLASILIFGLTIRGGGLLPAVSASTVVALVASRPFRPVPALVYGLFLGGLSSLAFVVGLGMQVRVIGPWFGF